MLLAGSVEILVGKVDVVGAVLLAGNMLVGNIDVLAGTALAVEGMAPIVLVLKKPVVY